ncbi:MAG: GNAT family N-acetyltransferase [Candidatus Krumholzibacteria bacterium]|nr:GNAT family N-acetyltransferase [Candidatus Krumholzibacteria bacterium]
MQIETIDSFPTELDEIARGSPDATFFQTSTWIESVHNSFANLECRCLVARAGGTIVGYLPFFVIRRGMVRRYWSLPFGTYGGAVVLADRSVADLLTDRYLQLRQQPGACEVALVDYQNIVRAPSLPVEKVVTQLLDLRGGFESVWSSQFDKSKRRQTRKAKREGIEILVSRSPDEVRQYHSIYAQRCVEWQQRMRYPESLFVELVRTGGERVKLFLARAGDTILGGHLNFYFGDTVIAWNGVTTVDSRSTQVSTLLYSTCIRHACENGYRRYNLGASLGKESLMLYKESLGGVQYPYRVLRWRSMSARIAAVARKLVPRR